MANQQLKRSLENILMLLVYMLSGSFMIWLIVVIWRCII